MRNLLEAVDPAGDDILCSLDHQDDAVWKMWGEAQLDAKTKKPGTIISYLTSYEKIPQFLSTKKLGAPLPIAVSTAMTCGGTSKCTFAKKELSEESVEKLLTVVHAGQLQRGKTQARKGKAPLKGKLKKWCPVPGCDQIVLDVGRHLRNKKLHNVAKDSREYQRLVRMAKRYKGLDELEDNVIPPPPAIVEIEVPRRDGSQSDSDGNSDDGPVLKKILPATLKICKRR
ncbi:hypothetical protein OS493_017396 [Desmophyllum pertusum]|uniref:Uncharacterized protein n=1 Tax=Desmophyllum pertusum TaxID=174260 RepID=A0A9X0A2L8_9CNID|nr:hypothetical protein OS493_017396 [Desmophyllum pertusum]